MAILLREVAILQRNMTNPPVDAIISYFDGDLKTVTTLTKV